MVEKLQSKGLGLFAWFNGTLSLLFASLTLVFKLTDSTSSDAALLTIIVLPLAIFLTNVVLLFKALWCRQFLLALLCGVVGCLIYLVINQVVTGLSGLGRHP